MAKDQQMTNQQSLEIIQQMIAQAKTNITDSGFGWLLWGTMIFLTCVSTYIFIDIGSENIFLGWNIFGLITVILLSSENVRKNCPMFCNIEKNCSFETTRLLFKTSTSHHSILIFLFVLFTGFIIFFKFASFK